MSQNQKRAWALHLISDSKQMLNANIRGNQIYFHEFHCKPQAFSIHNVPGANRTEQHSMCQTRHPSIRSHRRTSQSQNTILRLKGFISIQNSPATQYHAIQARPDSHERRQALRRAEAAHPPVFSEAVSATKMLWLPKPVDECAVSVLRCYNVLHIFCFPRTINHQPIGEAVGLSRTIHPFCTRCTFVSFDGSPLTVSAQPHILRR